MKTTKHDIVSALGLLGFAILLFATCAFAQTRPTLSQLYNLTFRKPTAPRLGPCP